MEEKDREKGRREENLDTRREESSVSREKDEPRDTRVKTGLVAAFLEPK